MSFSWLNIVCWIKIFADTNFTYLLLNRQNINDIFNAIFIYYFFTLFPAHSWVVRGNLVLRHTVTHYPPNSAGIACWLAELNGALYLDTKAKKWKCKLSKYFISSRGDRTHNQSILQSYSVSLLHDWPHLLYFL